MADLHDVRRDYEGEVIDAAAIVADPLGSVHAWLQQALQVFGRDANAIHLATVDANGQPHARMVLVKAITDHGLHFFTNYHSAKGRELEHNPQAAMTFYWPPLDQQIRLEGRVSKLPAAAGQAYFAARPKGSQLAAAASDQSRPLSSRDELLQRVERLTQSVAEGDVTCPSEWGGYCLVPHRIEFWQGMPSRLHDRVVVTKADDATKWTAQRLMP